jgi:hypothetical protein
MMPNTVIARSFLLAFLFCISIRYGIAQSVAINTDGSVANSTHFTGTTDAVDAVLTSKTPKGCAGFTQLTEIIIERAEGRGQKAEKAGKGQRAEKAKGRGQRAEIFCFDCLS